MDVAIRQAEPGLRVIAEVNGAIVATGDVEFWDEADGTRLYLLSGNVDPDRRRQGLGRRLLDRQEKLAAAHWRAKPGSGPPLAGLRIDGAPDRIALARAAGYAVRFTVVDLARGTAGAAVVEPPDGIVVGPAIADDLRPIQRLLKASFAHSGLGQEARDWAALELDLDLTLVARDGARIAAVISSEREDDGSVDSSWVAVDTGWRRRGLAQLLLQLNLRLLADLGIERATIRTVRENPNSTVELYEKAGYTVIARHPRWAKPLPGALLDGVASRRGQSPSWGRRLSAPAR